MPWIRCAAVVSSLALAATGCGSEEKASAKPEPSAPSSSATASASATPKPQPRGSSGATYDILNWDEYAADPAVLAWKKTLEAMSGSLLRGKLQPDVRKYTTDEMFRSSAAQVANALDDGWTVKRVGQVHVESSKTMGNKATLQLCLWSPTTSLFEKDGKPVGAEKVDQQWDRQVATVTKSGNRWRLSDINIKDQACKGVPRP